ncbi:hypothetical protein B1729_09940 [Microbacterium sp. B35-04]|nr:hypothetical protein B1729_09940 [Microbacterium sp. B35-04]
MIPRTTLPHLSAVVVHHNRHNAIGEVVHALVNRGLSAERLVVVDNSERPDLAVALQADLPAGTRTLFVRNDGYGAAVNAGLEALAAAGIAGDYTLVATHEVELHEQCLQLLTAALDADPSLVAVGPELRSDLSSGTIWSLGGSISPLLRLPVHRTTESNDGPAANDCSWLDGAVVLYRTVALPTRPFDESFFLYMEEVDLHLRLGYAGGRLAVVSGAKASQQSSGTPAFYFARNIRLLHRRHAPLGIGALQSIVLILRRMCSAVLNGRWQNARDLLRGATVTLPTSPDRTLLVNPLGAALKHYTDEAGQILDATGRPSERLATLEPSATDGGGVRWLFRYVTLLRRARRLRRSMPGSDTIVVWPILGFFDSILIRLFLGRGRLVIHDPVPLVRAVGYGWVGRLSARLLARRISLLTHSESAHNTLATSIGVPPSRIQRVPHPITTRVSPPRRTSSTRVVVLGQFKPDRDLDLLESLAGIADTEWELSIVGRGWPNVPGWRVDARFLSEAEFREQLEAASVILIPYRRFYQSGVAIRALESGTPVVGPHGSVLDDVLGGDSAWLATDDAESWRSAIIAAVTADAAQIAAVQERVMHDAIAGWREMESS